MQKQQFKQQIGLIHLQIVSYTVYVHMHNDTSMMKCVRVQFNAVILNLFISTFGTGLQVAGCKVKNS